MTDVDDAVITAPRPGPAARRRRWVLLATGVVVLVVATAGFLRWRDADTALTGYGSAEGAPVAVGAATYAGLMVYPATKGPDTVRLDLESVVPRIVTNTAGATVRVLLCTGAGTGAGGGIVSSPGADCTAVTDFRPGPVNLGSQTTLVLQVTPHQPGTVDVAGADVSYHHGLRNGHQHVGIKITLNARR